MRYFGAPVPEVMSGKRGLQHARPLLSLLLGRPETWTPDHAKFLSQDDAHPHCANNVYKARRTKSEIESLPKLGSGKCPCCATEAKYVDKLVFG